MKLSIWSQYHPAAALHQPRLWSDMLEDWTWKPTKIDSDYRIVPEGYPLGSGFASLDTETDGKGGIGQWSLAFRDVDGKLCVMPFYGPRPGTMFGDRPIVFHYAKYDLRELKANKMIPPKNYHDTMIAAYCLGLGKQSPKDDGRKKSGADMQGGLGLKYLVRRQLGMDMPYTWKDMEGHPERVPEYNARDAVGTYLLFEKWLPLLPKHYFEIDMPLLTVLMAMEDRGVLIDQSFLDEYAKGIDQSLATYNLPFNPQNPGEIRKYVYGTMGITPWKFTEKTHEPSTEEEVLAQLHDPVLDKAIEWNHLRKEKSTYVDNYKRMADFEGRIHPELKQTSTTTRRLSCARPNLQNVFKRDDRVKLRALFVAPTGKKIVRADFNQLDFRSLAAITQDPILIRTFEQGKKIHTMTAEEMNIDYDSAKISNFAVMFKGEAFTLAQQLKCSIKEAKDFMERYFKKFPGIKKYQDDMTEIIKAERKVTIPFENSVRRIDAMYVDNWKVQQEGIREGINLPVQGLEAYVVKKVMIDLHKLAAPMFLQIHDELLFEVEDSQVQVYAHWLRDYIPTIVGKLGGVDFPIEVGIGQNWYEAGLKGNGIK